VAKQKMDRNGAEYKQRYERVACPVEGCGQMVGKQGLANHIRKHGEQPQSIPAARPGVMPPKITGMMEHERYRDGYRQGWMDGIKHVVERMQILGMDVPLEKILIA
jgi:hypothetical protein